MACIEQKAEGGNSHDYSGPFLVPKSVKVNFIGKKFKFMMSLLISQLLQTFLHLLSSNLITSDVSNCWHSYIVPLCCMSHIALETKDKSLIREDEGQENS